MQALVKSVNHDTNYQSVAIQEKSLATMELSVSDADQVISAEPHKRERSPVPCQDSIHLVGLQNVTTVQLVMPVQTVALYLRLVQWESMPQ